MRILDIPTIVTTSQLTVRPAVRVGDLLRDPNDPRRRGVRWDEISLEDGSMDVYRKKQQWDAASLPDLVISPLRSYRQLMDSPTERWPVLPTLDQRTLATLVCHA